MINHLLGISSKTAKETAVSISTLHLNLDCGNLQHSVLKFSCPRMFQNGNPESEAQHRWSFFFGSEK
jgi:hypothetical protein